MQRIEKANSIPSQFGGIKNNIPGILIGKIRYFKALCEAAIPLKKRYLQPYIIYLYAFLLEPRCDYAGR